MRTFIITATILAAAVLSFSFGGCTVDVDHPRPVVVREHDDPVVVREVEPRHDDVVIQGEDHHDDVVVHARD